ncbi:MAG TPA: hypothetical protein VLZ05_22885 [Mycobacterium sp.]|nr:hypothetical protein [Mycobacterium sp.]HUH71476.1 hypothetical protein [Mycobacterium sp.]
MQHVAADGDWPVPACAVGAAPGEHPQPTAEEFSEAGDHCDRQRSGAKQPKVLAGDAARAFVGEIGEEAHHANHQDELQRRRPPRACLA